MTDSRSDDYLSDADASIVLDRASELSVHRDGQVNVAELRSIALEAGIPPEVFDRALADVRSAPVGWSQRESGASKKESSLVASLRRLALVSLGGALSALTYVLPGAFGIDTHVTRVFSVILASIAAAGLVTFRYPRREILKFEYDLVSLWFGLTLAWMVFDPIRATDVLVTTGIFGGLAGGLGAILIARSDADRPTAALPDPIRSLHEQRPRISDGESPWEDT
jgi:hypothetical protein